MKTIRDLEPQPVWKFFELICSVPHPSGSEAALAKELCRAAEKAGLNTKCDRAGNIRIDRPASPGYENVPTVILQGHLDMVPESDHPFDFLSTAITPVVDGEWLRAEGTTLGADNGIGVAHAMAVLCDKDLTCGALAGVFTVGEETGMNGAAAIDAEFLQGKYLLNCDHDSSSELCIGCAGGARQSFTFVPEWEAPQGSGVAIALKGLPGGHSGVCIHLDRGNAIRFLAEFLDMNPEIAIASIDAGSVDNAIPSEAFAVGASTLPPEKLQQLADAFTLLVKQECRNAVDMQLQITPAPLPEKVWKAEFRQRIVSALSLVPDGVLAFDEEFNAVRDSSNLAVIRTAGHIVEVCTSQRSLADIHRDAVCDLIKDHFVMFGAVAEKGNVYPATTPKAGGILRQLAMQTGNEMGCKTGTGVIHAGLESGWFSLKNPDLEIVSCGPYIEEYHTPRERVSIASVQFFDRFLRELLQKVALNG